MFFKVNVGPPMLPKTDQYKTIGFFNVLGGNGFYKVCEMAWAWPSKSFKNQWKTKICVCVANHKGLLGAISNHVAPSWAQNGFKMAPDGSTWPPQGLSWVPMQAKT